MKNVRAKREFTQYAQAQPQRRPLQIFASDPMLGRTAGNRISISIDNEPLTPGPCGSRIRVVDYDATNGRYYTPVDLNDAAILMTGGLEPTESDPRFHQQMVYAVAMRTLENFDRALGRRLQFRGRGHEALRIFPHAFYGANAFYHDGLRALLFGYFSADGDDPGPNLPGQTIFTCLSHDIIAHEMTHALVDRMRPLFREPSNVDVLAFHEGFSDIVALLQHFSFADLLRDEIQRTRTGIHQPTMLVELARQFGYATGAGRSLRSALDSPDAKLYSTVTEPHDRGSILVAAVFDAFFRSYQRRIRDLIRIATGGTGNIPDADLHPDLVRRVALEAANTAQYTLNMCIRAFEYLPPVDVAFGDYLRAMVTADYELVPDDEFGQRASMIEAFRRRGIYPEDVTSLAEESLLWESPSDLPDVPVDQLPALLMQAVRSFSRNTTRRDAPTEEDSSLDDEGTEVNVSGQTATVLYRYATENAAKLFLDPSLKISVRGFHPVFRVAPNGQLHVELVAQFTQFRDSDATLGGLPFRGGTTLVVAADGRVRYVIAKPLDTPAIGESQRKQAERRLERQREFVSLCDVADPSLAYQQPEAIATRMRARMNFAMLHAGAY
jgi:hypothetical protein